MGGFPHFSLNVVDLGRMGYVEALARQRALNQAVIDGDAPPTLLLVEHDPVITISHRREAGDHLIALPARLKQLGIDVQPTDRGGDITFHGPGQLVAYPIFRLNPLGLNLGRYMRLLEQIVMDVVRGYGVIGYRDACATGVWVTVPFAVPRLDPRGKSCRPPTSAPTARLGLASLDASRGTTAAPAKLCAMGVRVRRNTTMHGLALNVDVDLSYFDTIVPCGLQGRGVTSLRALLGADGPGMQRVKEDLAAEFRRVCEGLWAERGAPVDGCGTTEAGSSIRR